MALDRKAYNKQKTSASARGIPWNFCFESWIDLWERSGKSAERGCCCGKYVMARFGDVGAYEPGNVEIVLFEKNARDARTNHPRSQFDLRSRQIGSGRGWTKLKNGSYQVSVSKKYIGRFKTVEEAEVAYQRAASLMLLSSATNRPLVTPDAMEKNRKHAE